MPKKKSQRNRKKNKLKHTNLGRGKNSRIKSRSRKQNPSFLKRFLSSLFSGIILIVVLSILVFYFVLPLVFSKVENTQNTLIISNKLGEQNNDIMLAHLSNNEDNFIINISGAETISLENGYGDYSLGTVYQLLKIDNKSDQEIKSIFSSILKISIDDLVIANNISSNPSGDFSKINLKKIIFKNIIDRQSSSIDNKIKLITLFFLSDSMDIVTLEKVSDIQSIYYKLSTLKEESYKNCSVSVVNTTSETGLARKVSEIIENTGAQVMQVEGESISIKETVIYYPADVAECKQLIERISGIFPIEFVSKEIKDLPTTQQFRSNIVVMLGQNYLF